MHRTRLIRAEESNGRHAHARVSVLMPAWGHAAFIPRAIDSLLAQTFSDWELVIIDDASPDDTARVCLPYARDQRIVFERLTKNVGLGAALNRATALSSGELIAYLPSDDVYYADHLESLVDALGARADAVLAYSGVRHHYNRVSEGAPAGEPLQLVQVMHRRSNIRWTEREELVTDDLGRMYWSRLEEGGRWVGTGRVSCEWTDHPGQLHKLIREPLGGINPYRQKFSVPHPLRFHSTVGNSIDEVEQYRCFRERADIPRTRDALSIVLCGELAYNPERVLALEERGHALYGLWMREPYWYNTVGPLPFGHVQDLPHERWREELRALRPDIIYALLNFQAVPFAHQVMLDNPGVPFVWHFKEGPFICIEKGTWPQLMELCTGADGLIFSTPEMRDWFATVSPAVAERPGLVLDGDLPKRDWFDAPTSPLLSDETGEIHTVVPGRPIGLHPPDVARLARSGVHLHFYGDFTHGQWRAWIERVRDLAPHHLHLHPNVGQDRWVEEFSRYDAGWLHYFESNNAGDIRRADWDDLNSPARLATLISAGVPLIQHDNSGSIVATQTIARERSLGLFARDLDELAVLLHDRPLMDALRRSVWRQREQFTFDYHADRLLAFFREVIDARSKTLQRRSVPRR